MGRLLVRRLRGRYGLVTGLIGGLPTKEGFNHMVKWLAEGKLSPHVAATFDLAQIREAHQMSETGRTVGKIAVRIPPAAQHP
ncbi:zinc-binding dehydrogenase [Arthrobacter sp. JZ12]|uniref:zinc-binding dehydrogenase n=1 Tax=Arthrobacter sp. JZ12 TaxID=2654190 RepID=UPI002B46CDBD|nr:zinc-binding dehydrogenase [Arthrobacter sp. JZ12]